MFSRLAGMIYELTCTNSAPHTTNQVGGTPSLQHLQQLNIFMM